MNSQFINLPLNSGEALIMHIDINSCFATIEQQANPFLRGKPIAVVAHNYSKGCVLAASIEAKRYGVKTGTVLWKAKQLCPNIIPLSPDPDKYRDVHKKFRDILSDYSYDFYPKSIDEFVVNLAVSPQLRTMSTVDIAQEIKQRIRSEIGEWIRVSVGIGTNRFWAKTASNVQKPDGLTLMDKTTARDIYKKMKLVDIHGINVRNEIRLNSIGVYSPIEFLDASYEKLKTAFKTAGATYWYSRLRGYEIDAVEFARRSFGNTYSMPGGPSSLEDLAPILMKLVFKSTMRLRKAGFSARGVHLGVRYKEFPFWHKGKSVSEPIFTTSDIYTIAHELLEKSPRKPVANLAVTCFNLVKQTYQQPDLFSKIDKDLHMTEAVDRINSRWDRYTIYPARMLSQVSKQPEAIGFGNIRELV